MKFYFRYTKYLILSELFILFFFSLKKDEYLINNIYNYDRVSLVINMKNLTNDKHLYFNDIFQKLNATRIFYFVKTIGKQLDQNLYKFISDSNVKIVLSNFPDSIFLPFVISLYGNNPPDYVLFIEGEEILLKDNKELMKWIQLVYKKIKTYKYDYIFGNFKIINEKKIGCTLLFSSSLIIQHLLYNTDSDTTHANPFIQLSLATQTLFTFIKYKYTNKTNLDIINNKFSRNMNCPLINDKFQPSLCIILPTYKRNYFSNSFHAFSKQTYKPKFYLIIQNDNIKNFNFTSIQNMVDEKVYHIWMQNWNSFFFLIHRISSILPCDFVLKYDDDQWPNDNELQQKLIKNIKNKNIILGFRGYFVKSSLCKYSPKYFKEINPVFPDHVGVPLLIRPGYLKLDARNRIFRLYYAEDMSLSINSHNLCNVTSKRISMKIIERQKDGNNRAQDEQIIKAHKNENDPHFNVLKYSYCFFVRSGYIPKKWGGFKISEKDFINITIKSKGLY